MELWSWIPCRTVQRPTWLESETLGRSCDNVNANMMSQVSGLHQQQQHWVLTAPWLSSQMYFFLLLQIFHPRHDDPVCFVFLCRKESDRTENMINLYLVTIFKFTGAQSRKLQSLLVVQSFFSSFYTVHRFLTQGDWKEKWKLEKAGWRGQQTKKEIPGASDAHFR